MITCVNCDTGFLKNKSELVKNEMGEYICVECFEMKKDKNKAKYWRGTKNKLIRYAFYIKQGLGELNEIRNLFFIIIGGCFTFKEQYPILGNVFFVSIIFVISIFVLFIIGYVMTHHVKKVMEWLGIQFSSHWSRYTYDLMEKQIKILEDISDKVGEKDAIKAKNGV